MLHLKGHSGISGCVVCDREIRQCLYLAVREFAEGSVCTKIGISQTPCRRLESLNARCAPFPAAKLVHVERVHPRFSVGDGLFTRLHLAASPDSYAQGPGCMESHLHQIFAALRSDPSRCRSVAPREWFDISPEDVRQVMDETLRIWKRKHPPVAELHILDRMFEGLVNALMRSGMSMKEARSQAAQCYSAEAGVDAHERFWVALDRLGVIVGEDGYILNPVDSPTSSEERAKLRKHGAVPRFYRQRDRLRRLRQNPRR